MSLNLCPLTLKQANELIAAKHRHHKPVVGHRFTIGCNNESGIVGAATVGRPVAREIEQYSVAEVTRLVADGTPHVCSMLYAACARAAGAMGYHWIQTYILESESGTSLIAAGWYPITAHGNACETPYTNRSNHHKCCECMTSGGNWNHGKRKGRRQDQPMCRKQRWGKRL